MRRLVLPFVLLLSLATANAAAAAGDPPTSGFIVYKDSLRGRAVVEIRDDATGRLLVTLDAKRGQPAKGSECADAHHDTYARWPQMPTYVINAASIPVYLEGSLARAELVDA